MKKIKLFLLIFCLVSVSKLCFAGGAGTTMFQVLQIPASAYNASLANTYATGIYSAVSNPSVIPFAEYSLLLTHAIYFEDTNYSMAGFNLPINSYSGLNISVTYFDMGTMTRTLDDGAGNYIEMGKFGVNDTVGNIGYGIKLNDQFSAGASLKYIKQTIDDVSYGGAAFSFSGTYFTSDTFYLGAGLNNLGPQVAGYNLPTNLYFSAAGDVSDNAIALVQLDNYYNDDIYELKVATEVNLENIMFLRLGYKIPLKQLNEKFDNEILSNFTTGLGFKYDFISIDYAWLPSGDLGDTHMFSLLIKF